MLEAVILAEQKCHADWQIVTLLSERLPDGELRDAFAAAVAEVEAQEDHHVSWAQQTWATMMLTQADSSLMQKGMEMMEKAVGKVKDIMS
jgi:hypothetical protein